MSITSMSFANRFLIRTYSTAQTLKSVIQHPPVVPAQFKEVAKVVFPKHTSLQCNMMPFRMGDKQSLPLKYQHYWSLIESY